MGEGAQHGHPKSMLCSSCDKRIIQLILYNLPGQLCPLIHPFVPVIKLCMLCQGISGIQAFRIDMQ